jgi:hypothetical protein
VGFATKTPGQEVLIFPYLYALPVFQKDTKRDFSLYSIVLGKDAEAQSLLFISLKQ